MSQCDLKSPGFLYRNFHSFFILAYVLLLCQATASCYRIKSFSYTHILVLYISGILLYKLYSIVTTKAFVKLGLFLLGFLLLVLIYNLKQLAPLWNTYIIQNFNSINLAIYTESETYFHQFLPFLILIVPFITALAFTLSVKGKTEYSLIIFTLFMFSFWNNDLDKLLSKYIPWFIVLSLFFHCFCRYEALTGVLGKAAIKVNINFKNIFLYTIIAALSVTFLVSIAVRLFGYKSLVQLRSDYEINEAWLANSSKKSIFDLANTGYGYSGGKLGGPIQFDTLTALRVKAEEPTYLKGSVKDYYDGQSWIRSIDEYSKLGMDSLIIPTPDFILRMTGSANSKPRVKKMTIFHYGLATSTLFTPSNTRSISAKDGKVMYNTFHTFMLMGKETISEPYTAKYYISSTGIENFTTYKGANQLLGYESGSLKDNKDYIPYLQVPESISPRTRRLLEQIVEGCETNDEKVRRIMEHLSSSYSYSLDVSPVPEDIDFIDHFLFNEKKGYCTYFASAATIMFRLAGIPARYVEGFNMDTEMDSSGYYIVRNHRAHAWTEILVSPQSGLWCIADCVPQGISVSDISNSGQYKDRFDTDRYKSGDSRFSGISEEEQRDFGLKYYGSLFSLMFYPILVIPAILFLLISVYIIYKLVIFRKETGRVLKEESIIPLYRHLVGRLVSMGEAFPKESCELEFVKGMKDRELSKLLEKLVLACYSECYGGTDDSSLIDRKHSNRLIEKHMRRKTGFFRYWYCIIRHFSIK